MKNLFQILFFSSILFFGFFTCKPPEKVAPPFPPEKDLTLDFSYFINPPYETGNYAFAFQTSRSWADLFNDSVSLYKNMLNTISDNELKFQDNHTWLISDIYYSGDNQYDINYFEVIDADTVKTKLFFSLDSTYTNLLLFDGWFLADSTNGFRQINKPDTANTYIKFLKLEWNIIPSLNIKRTIKYTNQLLDNKNGNFILFKDSADNQYDSYFDFFDKASETHTIIEYNKASTVGRVKNLQYFGDENWHCWDKDRQDINCSGK